ncbi:methenyltetrahydromethanopterin cyclohydrolase [Ideonella alba]|uniref:Methenyltetrahydromethanopterin cyclohydrolase n=1 Tax=Ideonella alba TaxID=2824118 RepID=A0A941BDZ5_9BURK|nr:methenyltetrahydromethanopterin cyclohydrolase [Ideonella alba]MBQ0930661.1 methenyltetrahydromethanopterin cyclohydrolase [Ideonella alba]
MSSTTSHRAWPSPNDLAVPLVAQLLQDAERLGVCWTRDERGTCIVDAGIDAPGSIAAGLLIGRICMGGLGEVSLVTDGRHGWANWLQVSSPQPVLACLGSQYAGWSLAASKEETGGKKFFALGSGPARALAAKEKLFDELAWRDAAGSGVLVLEVDRAPPRVVIDKVLRDTGLAPEALTIVLTPTSSRAGTTQVVARVLEVALHKAHELGFALDDIVDGTASAPLPSPTADGAQAMGRTNDAILYGGLVTLSVNGEVEAARSLAQRLPSGTSRDYGKPFADIFSAAGYDFYKIDPALFAPAAVVVQHLPSGRSFEAGRLDMPVLLQGWREAA